MGKLEKKQQKWYVEKSLKKVEREEYIFFMEN